MVLPPPDRFSNAHTTSGPCELTYTHVALFELAMEQFTNDNPDIKDVCQEVVTEVEEACSVKNARAEFVKQANASLQHSLTQANVFERLHEWQEQKAKNAMFRSMMNYLHRVETILFFVAASRNADLQLHLEAGEALSKLFFAMNRIKYKRLWLRYIADMHALKLDHPETWRELEEGNISVTKNAIPFVSIGADHACEHLNKLMKVHAGLAGISNNPNARQRFFMAMPELSSLAKKFKEQLHTAENKEVEHHDLSPSTIQREHRVISNIKDAILRHGNPFAVEGNSVYNLITHAYIPDEYVPQILNIDAMGQKLYEDYVSERINGDVSLWAPVKRENNKMYMSGIKKHTVKVRDKTIDLKETKSLYGRLMVLARSNRDIDHKQAIGTYEFTLTPRALFTPSGSMLMCSDKSKLIHALEKLVTPGTDEQTNKEAGNLTVDVGVSCQSQRIAVVDGMVLVQKLAKKPAMVVTVSDLSVCFNDRLMSLTRNFDEVILVFDTYKQDSLKRHKTKETTWEGSCSIPNPR